jgi:hypothetical protein
VRGFAFWLENGTGDGVLREWKTSESVSTFGSVVYFGIGVWDAARELGVYTYLPLVPVA